MSNSKAVVVGDFKILCHSEQPERTYNGKLYGESVTIFGLSFATKRVLLGATKSLCRLRTGFPLEREATWRSVRFGYLKMKLSPKEQNFGKSSDGQLPNFKVVYYYGENTKKVVGGPSIL